jgi:hypothetical protein
MSISSLLRTAIGTFGFFVLTAPPVLAMTQAEGTPGPTATAKTNDSTEQAAPSVSIAQQPLVCRTMVRPGSRIAERVCTPSQLAEHRARINEVVTAFWVPRLL